MSNIIPKVKKLLEFVDGIKEAVSDNIEPVSTYKETIDAVNNANVMFDENSVYIQVEPTNATIHKADGTTAAILYSKYVGILDENGKEWDVKEWDAEYVKQGRDNSKMPKPVGFWTNYKGRHYHAYQPWGGPLYDISGTVQHVNTSGNLRMQHSLYNYTMIATATTGTTTCLSLTAGSSGRSKYNANTYKATVSGDTCTLTADNTKRSFSFTLPKTIGGVHTAPNGAIVYHAGNELLLNSEEMIYANNEWLRDRYAINSGVTTTSANGTVKKVDILNSSGNKPSVNEDMYFWIDDTICKDIDDTPMFAKYNLHALNTNAFVFNETHRTAVYNAQKASGINMNDTGVNSALKHILVPGAKGAEAIAVDGYWYIATPIVTLPNEAFTNNNNVLDSPAIYHMKWVRETNFNTAPNNAHLTQAHYLHLYFIRRSIYTAITTMLKTHLINNNVTNWTADTVYCWASCRYGATYSWCVYSSGSVGSTFSYNSYVVVPVVAVD